MSHARAAAIGLAIVALVAAAEQPAAAQAETDVPNVRFATVFGGRQNVGAFGQEFGRGWMWGFEAGWHSKQSDCGIFTVVCRTGVAWSIGWSVPSWAGAAFGGSFESVDAESVAEEVSLTEMSLGLRSRWPLGEDAPRFLLVNAGVTVMRASIPIPPDSSREYVGPYAGAGLEQLLVGRYMIGLEARYGMFLGGPSGLTVSISLGFGSK